MTAAVRYRVRNWANYNQSLINRGNLMIWFDDDIMQAWNAIEPNGQRGRDKIFSDLAIECALTLRRLFPGDAEIIQSIESRAAWTPSCATV